MNKAYYIDTYSKGNLHEMYNASSLLMFSYMFGKIIYVADNTSKQNVENLLKKLPHNIIFKKIFVPSAHNKIMAFFKQIFALINNCYYIIKANKKDIVIINYNTMSNIYIINFFAKMFNKKVLIICHGEMLTLCMELETSKIFSLSKTFFTNENINIASGLYFSVLGDVILKNLKPYISNKIYQKFIPFDHSAIFNNTNSGEILKNEKLEIGVLGIRANKGFLDLINLGNQLKCLHEKLNISIIGKIDCDYTQIINAGIKISDITRNSFLSREEMYHRISKLDVILFVYPTNSYKVTASGALFDAIDCEKPIIAIKNDYFEYIFKKYGSFGCLVNSFEELESEIRELVDGKNYNVDFNKIKKNISPESLAQDLLKKFNEKII